MESDTCLEAEVLYRGLKNQNTGFDAPSIAHFCSADFATVINRCEALRLGINGIEVFEIVDGAARLLDIVFAAADEKGYAWARRVAERYGNGSNVTFSATFCNPVRKPHP